MKYNQVHDGDLIPIFETTYMACCDCDLVHKMVYKEIGGNLFARVHRDNKRTSQRRRHSGKKVVQ